MGGHTINGRQVGNIGFGMLSLTWGRTTQLADEEAFAVMRAALAAGCNFWDGGQLYGTPERNSLTLLNSYFQKYPEDADKIVLNIKGCSFEGFRQDSSPEGVKKSVENAVRALGDKGRIDQFEAARKDRNTPIEVTMEAFNEHIRLGHFSQAALSEVSAETIRRAARVAKIGAVEVELSLWNTDPLTNGVLETCAELDILVLAYSPLGRGALTGAIKSIDDLPEKDFRRMMPRFHPDNLETNVKLLNEIEQLAKAKGCLTGQVAINWILALSRRPGMPKIIPIPGTSNAERVKENSKEIDLSDEEMEAIDKILANFPVRGERYHEGGMALLDR